MKGFALKDVVPAEEMSKTTLDGMQYSDAGTSPVGSGSGERQ